MIRNDSKRAYKLRYQLKNDIQDTINMNKDTQEQLRNARVFEKTPRNNMLKIKISEETSKNLHIEEHSGETRDKFQEKMVGIDKSQNLDTKKTKLWLQMLRIMS